MSIPAVCARIERARHALRRCVSFTAVVVATLASAQPAIADICKYLDRDGVTHYSNLPPEKGWKRISCADTGDNFPSPPPKSTGRVDNVSARPSSSATPSGFPRVDASTQKGRDDIRRKVLMDELAAEEKLLAEARTNYADGAPAPLADEKSNVDKYRDRIGKLRQVLSVHQKNVEALKKEIAAVK